MGKLLFAALFVIFISADQVASQFNIGDACTSEYNNQPGTCKQDRSCINVVQDSLRGIKITYCSRSGGVVGIVCCPNRPGSANQNANPSSSSQRISAKSEFMTSWRSQINPVFQNVKYTRNLFRIPSLLHRFPSIRMFAT